MKRQALMSLTSLSLLIMLTAAPVCAQSGALLKANIPFEFSVQGKLLPAGEYTITHGPRGLLIIRSADCRSFKIFGAFPTAASRVRDESSLVFNRHGDQYFLSKIWTAGTEIGEQLFMSPSEERLVAARRGLERNAPSKTVSIVVGEQIKKTQQR